MASYLPAPPSTPPTSFRISSSLRSPSTQTRPLSDNELSYFLPSRSNGVNDMYLHHHLTTSSPPLFQPERIAVIWAILRGRHPLLASKVVKTVAEEWSFSYQSPSSPKDALDLAFDSLSVINDGRSSTDLISSYLNGPRLLSPSLLSFLVVSSSSLSPINPEAATAQIDILFCTTHFVGDGIALHQLANEFYGLVGGSSGEGGEARSLKELRRMLEGELECRDHQGTTPFPRSTEDLFASTSTSKDEKSEAFLRATSKIALERSQRRAIGFQTLPRLRATPASRVHTVVPTISYTPEQTKNILSRCKAQGVSVSNAVFGLVAVAWARMLAGDETLGRKEDPLLLYSALSLRPLLPSSSSWPTQSYFHLSLGYYTVSLPSFLPSPSSSSSIASTFWHRSRCTKAQTLVHFKSHLLVDKSSAEARLRRERAVGWAMEDDRAASALEKERQKVLAGGLFGLGIGLEVEEEKSRVEVVDLSGPQLLSRNKDEREASLLPTPPSTPRRVSLSSFPSPLSPVSLPPLSPPPTPLHPSSPPLPAASSAPSTSLLGLSLLGNLDALYAHSSYSANLTLTHLTTGSRQRPGAALLFAYTFQGRLFLSLGWDEGGFGAGKGRETVRGLWRGVKGAVEEFLV